jgi:enamine deaminase RidA (YjgF/YER057c/UK114 family)
MTPFLTPVAPESFPWFDYSRYSFSLGVTRGNEIWLSGHSASEFDPGTGHIVVHGGMRAQATTAYAKIQHLLEASGSDFSHVVHVVENVTADGIADYAEAAAVREQLFVGYEPAVSTVIVRRLLRPAALIEIEVTACREGSTAETENAAGGVVNLPTLLPVDASGAVVSPGDLLGQTQFVYDRAAEMLGTLGLGMDHVVKTLDFTTPATRRDYAATSRVRKGLLGPVYPAAAGILMPRLFHRDVLIALEVTASRHVPVAVNPGWSRYDKLTYSPAVRAGSHLFLSGQGALNVETEEVVHEGDIVAQAEYIYGNILTVLRAGGAGPENLVRTVEYVTPEGLEAYRDVARVRERLLSTPYPASTGIVCEGLLRREFLLEVDPTAVLA